MGRGLARAAGALVLIAALGCASEPAPAHRPGLSVFLDSRVVWEGSRERLLETPSDYRRGSLRGWTVFGALLPTADRSRLRSIVAIAADGRHVTVDAPPARAGAFEPVVYLDRRDALRFTLKRPDEPGFPHGRGPGDGRGGGGRQGTNRPDTLEDVTEIRVATAATAHDAAAASGVELVLAIGGATERLTMATLGGETAEPLAARPGETAWPLRALVARRTDHAIREVVIVSREGERHVVDATTWRGTKRLDLRLNRRGLLKFEAGASGPGRGRQADDVRDVVRIDVAVE